MKTSKLIRRLFTILFLALISNIAYPQAPEWSWVTDSDGPGDERTYRIARDGQGNIFTSGTYKDAFTIGALNISDAGSMLANGIVVKYDASGTPQWAVPAGDPSVGIVFVNGIDADLSGNLYMCGSFLSFFPGGSLTVGSVVIPSSGSSANSTTFVIKLDQNGNAIWGKSIIDPGLAGFALNTSIKVDTAGNFYMAGGFSSSLLFGQILVSSMGAADIFLAKGDSSGNFLWAQNMGSLDDEQNVFMESGPDGSVFLSSYWAGDSVFVGGLFAVNDSPAIGSNYDRWIAKFDNNGNALWLNREAGPGEDYQGILTATPDGGVMVFSDVIDSLTINNQLVQSPSMLLTRYDAQGNLLMVQPIGDNNGATAIVNDGTDYYIACIYTATQLTIGSFTLNNAGGISGTTDAVIAKISATGSPVWAIGLGGSEEDIVNRLLMYSSGRVLAGGFTANSQLSFGSHTIYNTGLLTVDCFLAELDLTAGIADLKLEGRINVFPNPASDILNLETEINLNRADVRIININGQIVRNMKFDNREQQVNISDLSPGLYFLEIVSENTRYTGKFVKRQE